MTTTTRRLTLCLMLAAVLISAAPARAVNNGDVPVNTPASARRMIEHLTKTYGAEYPRGRSFLASSIAILASRQTKAMRSNNIRA